MQAFKKAKELVLSDTVQIHYSPNAEIRIETDTSNEVVIRVLTQQQKDDK